MLFLPPEAPAPIRAQGVMVSDQEVERVISFWQQNTPTQVGEITPWEDLLTQEAEIGQQDRLLEQAARIVRDSGRASASLLQRRLHIGYPRAARLIDELEDNGVIGPAVGGGRDREVYSSEELD
jgi:S-DNA-T family DNA segregation ATPase FtsK/SpoIIIE